MLNEEQIYINIDFISKPKRGNDVCGDIVDIERNAICTYIIVADGMGQGIKANIAATMCVARLKTLLKSDFSMREAFLSIAKSMNNASKDNMPYVAFCLVRILPNGLTTILDYDFPTPILISHNNIANLLESNIVHINDFDILESDCKLNPGNSLFICSDGITQSGIGNQYPYGWNIKNINSFINTKLTQNRSIKDLPALVQQKAAELCGGYNEDDATALLAQCKTAKTIAIFAGPPSDANKDIECFQKYDKLNCQKILCGATTAKIYAKVFNKTIESLSNKLPASITPPTSKIDGIDLVTEGTVTLNQLYHIIDMDRDSMVEFSAVTQLYDYLLDADQIIFFTPKIASTKNDFDISYIQLGLMKRDKTIALLAEKLKQLNKQVIIEYV